MLGPKSLSNAENGMAQSTIKNPLSGIEIQAATLNLDYFDAGSCWYYQIGKIVVLEAHNWRFKKVTTTQIADYFVTGVPAPSAGGVSQFLLFNMQDQIVRLTVDGTRIRNHYSSVTTDMLGAGHEFYGSLVYFTA